ncbi:hypothetical protein LSH36_474g01047 [Paralvinella palmiformis]|uniref:Uncharacterized protein n=1 Tax=Paralvinella palmiformis TaxID=53620 RepID=A0AAD9MXC3_9ANNE|nr:hypothetical protein LSH36_474g01047 [Paralvinella palmiformis]
MPSRCDYSPPEPGIGGPGFKSVAELSLDGKFLNDSVADEPDSVGYWQIVGSTPPHQFAKLYILKLLRLAYKVRPNDYLDVHYDCTLKLRGDYPGTSLEMEERSSSHVTSTELSMAADTQHPSRQEYHQSEKHLEAHLMALLKQDQDGDSASSADMSNTDSGRGASEEGEGQARYNTIAHPGDYLSHQGSSVSLCGTQHGYIHPRHLRPPPRPQPRLIGQGHPYAHGHTISGSPGRPVIPNTNLQHRKAASDVDVQRPCLARKALCSGETSASLQSLPSASSASSLSSSTSHYQSPGAAKHVTFTGSGPTSPANSDERVYVASPITAQHQKDNSVGQGNYGNVKGSQSDDVWQRRRRQDRALRDIREEDDVTRNDDDRVDSEEICQQIDEIFFKQKSVMV